MPDQTSAQQFQLLRARIEAEMPAPACITVTSACERDGKSVTASGLAEHLAAAGYRVLIVDASNKGPVKDRLGSAAPGGAATVESVLNLICKTTTHKLHALRLAHEFAAAASAETIRALTRACRDAYDYTFIDASRLLEGNLGLLFAAASDGTLLSIRRGRKAVAADTEMVQVLESGHVRVLGVVTTSQAAIREHSRRGARSGATIARSIDEKTPAAMSAVRSG